MRTEEEAFECLKGRFADRFGDMAGRALAFASAPGRVELADELEEVLDGIPATTPTTRAGARYRRPSTGGCSPWPRRTART